MQGIITILDFDFDLCTRNHAEYPWLMLVNLISSRLAEQGIITRVSGNCSSLIRQFESNLRLIAAISPTGVYSFQTSGVGVLTFLPAKPQGIFDWKNWMKKRTNSKLVIKARLRHLEFDGILSWSSSMRTYETIQPTLNRLLGILNARDVFQTVLRRHPSG